MRIAVTLGAEPLGAFRPPAELVADAVEAEKDGFAAAWMTHMTRGIDALTTLAAAALATSSLDLGVGVVPTYPRHPHALAQQAATVQALAGGRLTLGIGVSHRPVIEGALGLPYASPAEHLREYLSVLVPLLRDGSVTFAGTHYAVDAGFSVPGTSPVQVVVGGMGPRTVDVAGRHADGLLTWLAGRRVVAEEIGPALRAAAADTGRPAPRLVVALPVCVTGDADAARDAAATTFARYEGLTNYATLLDRQGGLRPADLAIVGDEAAVAQGIAEVADAGATELWAIAYAPDGDPDAARRTRTLLAGLGS